MSDAELRAVLMSILAPRLDAHGIEPEALDETASLVDLGIVDSLAFLELTGALEDQTGLELDFSEADPEQFTSLAGLLSLLESAARS